MWWYITDLNFVTSPAKTTKTQWETFFTRWWNSLNQVKFSGGGLQFIWIPCHYKSMLLFSGGTSVSTKTPPRSHWMLCEQDIFTSLAGPEYFGPPSRKLAWTMTIRIIQDDHGSVITKRQGSPKITCAQSLSLILPKHEVPMEWGSSSQKARQKSRGSGNK